MKIIRPVTIGDDQLVSSDIPENDYVEYSPATTYSVGERVIVTDVGIHRIYEALKSTTGEYPPDNTTGETPAWLDVGPTNRWAMFDGRTGTPTTSADSDIVVDIIPSGVINSIAILGLSNATSVQVVMTDPTDGVVYNNTVQLVDTEDVSDWYTYFFEPVSYRTDLTLLDLPPYSTATTTVTITGSSPSCDILTLGSRFDIGFTSYGSSSGITDYSRKETDVFGNPILIKRRFTKRAEFDVTVLNAKYDSVQKELAKYRSEPMVWIGSDNYTSMILYGFYNDFDIILSNFSVSECTLTIEGL